MVILEAVVSLEAVVEAVVRLEAVACSRNRAAVEGEEAVERATALARQTEAVEKGYGRGVGNYPPNFLRQTGRHVHDMIASMITSCFWLRDLFTPQSDRLGGVGSPEEVQNGLEGCLLLQHDDAGDHLHPHSGYRWSVYRCS